MSAAKADLLKTAAGQGNHHVAKASAHLEASQWDAAAAHALTGLLEVATGLASVLAISIDEET